MVFFVTLNGKISLRDLMDKYEFDFHVKHNGDLSDDAINEIINMCSQNKSNKLSFGSNICDQLVEQ